MHKRIIYQYDNITIKLESLSVCYQHVTLYSSAFSNLGKKTIKRKNADNKIICRQITRRFGGICVYRSIQPEKGII